jgi:hypothetical protein
MGSPEPEMLRLMFERGSTHAEGMATMTTKLPTADEMLARADAELSVAYKALGDAADWLRSDWRPVGSSLTKRQAGPAHGDVQGHRCC